MPNILYNVWNNPMSHLGVWILVLHYYPLSSVTGILDWMALLLILLIASNVILGLNYFVIRLVRTFGDWLDRTYPPKRNRNGQP